MPDSFPYEQKDAPPILTGWDGGRRLLSIDFDVMKPGGSILFERTDPEVDPEGHYLKVTIKAAKRA